MPAVHRFGRACLAATLFLTAFTSPVLSRQDPRDESLVCIFESGVDQYVQLHRRLERLLPPQVITLDPVQLFTSRWLLSAEIRQERAFAKQGDIFTPELAVAFRQIVARTLTEERIDWGVFLHEDGMYLPLDVVVNGDYPAFGPVATMPPTLLKVLPPLPAELQYRFVNDSLILWDVHAALIVDFVPDIFRRTTVPPPVTRP